jgi:hypothetical protein
MSERHTKGTLVSWVPNSATGDNRSALGRASDDRPFKPYVYRGGDLEPPAVIAARERYQAHKAELDALAAEREQAGEGDA